MSIHFASRLPHAEMPSLKSNFIPAEQIQFVSLSNPISQVKKEVVEKQKEGKTSEVPTSAVILAKEILARLFAPQKITRFVTSGKSDSIVHDLRPSDEFLKSFKGFEVRTTNESNGEKISFRLL